MALGMEDLETAVQSRCLNLISSFAVAESSADVVPECHVPTLETCASLLRYDMYVCALSSCFSKLSLC